jgi:hypothetical protein
LQDYSEVMAYGSISLSFLPISISCSKFTGIKGNVIDTPTVIGQQVKVRVHNRLGISYRDALYLWHLGTASRDRVGTHRPSIFRSSQYTTASIPVLKGISRKPPPLQHRSFSRRVSHNLHTSLADFLTAPGPLLTQHWQAPRHYL